MNLSQNYFELFNLPVSTEIDQQVLSSRYRKLQQDIHPDRFASKGAAEQRVAVQFTAHVNTAFQTLKNTLERSEYLLLLAGCPVEREKLTIDDHAFLMQQMEWRETLSDLSDSIRQGADINSAEQQLDKAISVVKKEQQSLSEAFNQYYRQQDYQQAEQVIAKWHFVNKLQNELHQLAERLD